MTINTIERKAARPKRSLVESLAVGLGALALSLAASMPAQAAGTVGTLDDGHVDGIHVAINSSGALVLGANNESGVNPQNHAPYFYGSEFNAASGAPQWDFSVKHTLYHPATSTWVIPNTQPPSGIYLGFAVAGEEDPDSANGDVYGFNNVLSSYVGSSITYTLQSVTTNGSGTVDIAFPSSANVTVTHPSGTVAAYTATLHSGDEAFHAHPQWTFTGSVGDTFKFTFVASTTAGGGLTSSPITYQVTLE